ncbi:uncharacterized protein E0L32_004683 [Thyridium curvatum]|uniref:DNA polymerase n=1 Tax=Thyridium curvatum TaxID=1093900 RepID=A0A507AWH0_9PEZI|nr:uncharacterized protein E0L32_004683 [Thyridium curvatum]TPX15125.1 hypothetical protein E0L32_004683 [Thyridium curvatum]
MALAFPTIYLLPTHLTHDELHEVEEQIPSLTYDANEAEVILGKVSRRERALFELRHRKIATEDIPIQARIQASSPSSKAHAEAPSSPASATSTVSTLDTLWDSDHGIDDITSGERVGSSTQTLPAEAPRKRTASTNIVRVVKLAWFTDSVAEGKVLPVDKYLVYEGRKINAESAAKQPKSPTPKPKEILARAAADAANTIPSPSRRHGPGWRRSREARSSPAPRPPALLSQTTSEHDIDEHLPPIPDFLHTTYSCQRPTPVNPPNEDFIEELKKIRTVRTLTGDKIGVRAYSTAIATIAAYPYRLLTAAEVGRLPGCGSKIAVLFHEYKETGFLREAKAAEEDAKLSVLKLFYEIWGVAETTAREFYKRGWRDLDDVVEYGWNGLSRVQQIGLKYYDEFQLKIHRKEVEAIAEITLAHANRIRKGFQMVIVGGYRRGKEMSGDVDLILSHPDESATSGFIEKIVLNLEKNKYITHTLTLSMKNSERGQHPVSWKGNDRKGPSSGFDTLDKALVVWQDPDYPAHDSGGTPLKKNPNPHRRVDIIISPWKTTGCAVLGWTSGTTFQRDLRRYCKRERGLKFDSSGIRSRADGAWVDLEDAGMGKAPDMVTAERRVFDGLGLEWRPPEERCTG